MNKKKLIIIAAISGGVLVLGLLGYFGLRYIPLATSPFNAKANPLKVSFATNDKSVSKLIDAAGGAVTLDGQDAQFSLNVPKDGVYATETLTLKQIKSVDGLGQGATFVAGVQATPAGTSLLAPAELVVEKPATGKLIGFAFEEDGKNFHLYPITYKNGRATMKISHFSGYGVIAVGDGSYTPPTPESIEAKAQQLISDIILEGQQESGTLNQNQLDRIYNLMNAWWKIKVKTDLEKAVTNEELVIPAFDRYLVWLAGVQGLGLDKRFEKEQEYALNTAAKATKNAYEKSTEKCIKGKDATQIARIIKLSKFAQKWGLNGRAGLSTDNFMEKVKSCANFELRIKSNYSYPETSVYSSAQGTIKIGMDNNYNMVGSGTVNQLSIGQEGFTCSYTGPVPTFPVNILSTKLDATTNEKKVSISMQFDEVDNTLVCKSTLANVDFTSTSHSDDWLTDFFIVYYDEGYTDPGIFTISDWQIVNSGGIYAKKVNNRSKTITSGVIEPYTVNENTTFELAHTPK